MKVQILALNQKDWMVSGKTLKVCLKNQAIYPPQPTGGEFMILRASSAQPVYVVAGNELLVYAPGNPVAIEGTFINTNESGTQWVYLVSDENSMYQSQLDYKVKPKVPGAKIKGLGLVGVTEIIEWYSGGYDGFATD